MGDLENIPALSDQHLFNQLLSIARASNIEFIPKPAISENIKDLYFLLKHNNVELNDIIENTVYIDYLKIDPIDLPTGGKYDGVIWYLYNYRDRLHIFLKMALNVDPNFWRTNQFSNRTELFNKFFTDRNITIDENYGPTQLEVDDTASSRSIIEDTRYMIGFLSDIQMFEFAIYCDRKNFFVFEVELADFVDLVK